MGFKAPGELDAFVMAEAGAESIEPDVARVRVAVRKLGALEVGSPVVAETIEYPIVARPFAAVPPSIGTVMGIASSLLAVPRGEVPRRHARGLQSQLKRVVIHASRLLGIATSCASDALNISRQRGSRVALTPLLATDRAVVAEVVAMCRAADLVG